MYKINIMGPEFFKKIFIKATIMVPEVLKSFFFIKSFIITRVILEKIPYTIDFVPGILEKLYKIRSRNP